MMRVSTLLAASSALALIASAEQVLQGRSLHNEDPDDSRSETFTIKIPHGPEFHGGEETFEGMYQVGVILGFIVTGLFMLFGAVTLCMDEANRHKMYKFKIMEDEQKMRSTYKVGEDRI